MIRLNNRPLFPVQPIPRRLRKPMVKQSPPVSRATDPSEASKAARFALRFAPTDATFLMPRPVPRIFGRYLRLPQFRSRLSPTDGDSSFRGLPLLFPDGVPVSASDNGSEPPKRSADFRAFPERRFAQSVCSFPPLSPPTFGIDSPRPFRTDSATVCARFSEAPISRSIRLEIAS